MHEDAWLLPEDSLGLCTGSGKDIIPRSKGCARCYLINMAERKNIEDLEHKNQKSR